MNTPDPTPPPTLRLNIQRTITAGLVKPEGLAVGTLATVATIKFENAVFQPANGLEFTGSGGVAISFPDPSTLQIAVRPKAQRIVQGIPAAIFVPSVTVLKNLGVLLSDPAAALVGEITHTQGLGEIKLNVVDSADGCTLSASAGSRPFALKTPLL